ncbi:hypothetical protein A3A36_01790 [Candidatus Kaiserbacteria bacterium RIFCSPLOWO2_01_FULL_52_12b]|uniref:Uncharacterized protein n=1 Tax=Candidatus Kaiserbacteria bacterium RIFCSPLOWO2_01_FULL_52_12b TaxID=1798509 RepID=A0A1F6EX70_9BACT|nr:MAG: hypothetical protein A3A36_01790 [Candidatus Kaiserbacteria bacterium RIFCSPLOWO2_01_FULL_52_12b]
MKFSAFYIPIVVVLDLLIYPNLKFGLGFMSGYQPTNYFLGVDPFGWLYVILTAAIVLISWFRNRK